MDVRLTLVSGSPQRRELLSSLGLPFEVVPTRAAELWTGDSPEHIAVANARRKVERSTVPNNVSRILLGADTIISVGAKVFGKPAGPDSAGRMLSRLSGQWHRVITGYCLVYFSRGNQDSAGVQAGYVVTEVKMRIIDTSELSSYLCSSEWEDKAGAYAIQGKAAAFVEDLRGDYSNVVGLPVERIRQEIEQHYAKFRFL